MKILNSANKRQSNYTYDNNGNRTTENGQTTSYTYDNLNRLAEVEYPTSQIETFTYDNAGNRLSKILGEETTTYTYDANNRLTESITNQLATNYTYDNNGNLLTETKNGQITTNTYDGFNRLIETANPDGTYQENIYDALGLRVGTIENGLSYEFTYDRGNIINETNAKGETISRSIRGYNLIAQDNVEDGLSYYLNNAHGDIVNLVDIEGNIQNYYNYDAFGNLQEAIVTVNNRFLYSGEQLDEITGNYYLRARYYNPEIGRFTQEDTYRGDGLNLYAYVANNPVNYIDPSGHCKCDEDDSNSFTLLPNFSGDAIINNPIFIPGKSSTEVTLLGYSDEGTSENNAYDILITIIDGIWDGFSENTTFGLYENEDAKYYEHQTAYQAGQIIGDVASIFTGLFETAGGAALFTGGTAVDCSGVGAVVGVPAQVAGATVIGTGASTIVNSGTNLVDDTMSLFSGKGKNDSSNPNLNRVDDKYLKQKGIDPHALKKDVYGKKAKVAEYDIYVDKNTGELYTQRKPQYNKKGEPSIPTGEFIK